MSNERASAALVVVVVVLYMMAYGALLSTAGGDLELK